MLLVLTGCLSCTLGQVATAQRDVPAVRELLATRQRQGKEILEMTDLGAKLVRKVRKADSKQDRLRFRLFVCEHRREEALAMDDLSDDDEDLVYEAGEGATPDLDLDLDEEEDFSVMPLRQLEEMFVHMNQQLETASEEAATARAQLRGTVLPVLPELRFERRLHVPTPWTPRSTGAAAHVMAGDGHNRSPAAFERGSPTLYPSRSLSYEEHS